jgi:hypothetical protein
VRSATSSWGGRCRRRSGARRSSLDEATGSLSGPGSFGSADWDVRRADDVVILAERGRVAAYVVIDPSAQLSAGAGVGDSLDLVDERYDGFRCEGVALGSDSREPVYDACRSRLGGDVLLWVGGDPIDSIWVLREWSGSRTVGPPRRR